MSTFVDAETDEVNEVISGHLYAWRGQLLVAVNSHALEDYYPPREPHESDELFLSPIEQMAIRGPDGKGLRLTIDKRNNRLLNQHRELVGKPSDLINLGTEESIKASEPSVENPPPNRPKDPVEPSEEFAFRDAYATAYSQGTTSSDLSGYARLDQWRDDLERFRDNTDPSTSGYFKDLATQRGRIAGLRDALEHLEAVLDDASLLEAHGQQVKAWAAGPFDVYVEPPRLIAAVVAALHNDDFQQETARLNRRIDRWKHRCQKLGEVIKNSGLDRTGVLATAKRNDGSTPPELLSVPGFINSYVAHLEATAAYPNRVLSFCAALALLSHLTARKIRDASDIRTNIYLLALAFSATGKDHGRRKNSWILNQLGLGHCIADNFASGEAIEDALAITPSILLQCDEIDAMLQQIKNSKDGRFEALSQTLLKVNTSASGIYNVRRKASDTGPRTIDQPHLTVYGTATPTTFYSALNERMLTAGFFSRMIVIESAPRGRGQDPTITDVPQEILEECRHWVDFQPGKGNLRNEHPIPAIVPYTDEAAERLRKVREFADDNWGQANTVNDGVAMAVWGRCWERVKQFALLYAASENAVDPKVTEAAVDWAERFVVHQINRMLKSAADHVAETEHDRDCLKARRFLEEAGGRLPQSVLLKKMKVDVKTLTSVLTTLVNRNEVQGNIIPTKGRPAAVYELISPAGAFFTREVVGRGG